MSATTGVPFQKASSARRHAMVLVEKMDAVTDALCQLPPDVDMPWEIFDGISSARKHAMKWLLNELQVEMETKVVYR